MTTTKRGRVGDILWRIVDDVAIVNVMFGGEAACICKLHVSELPSLVKATRAMHRATLPVVGWVVRVGRFYASSAAVMSRAIERRRAVEFPSRDAAVEHGRLLRDINGCEGAAAKITLIPVRRAKAGTT